MTDPFDWDKLQSDVSEVQQPFADDAQARSQARARLLAEPRVADLPQNRTRTWVFLAAAAVLVLGLSRLDRPEQALSFRVGASQATAAVGTWLPPEGGGEVPLRFSDGTVVSPGPATRTRVLQTTAHGASIELERGALHVAVVRRAGGDWRVGAGPFTVRVTGTQFDVAWNPSERTFRLALQEGTVLVEGPTLGNHGRWLKLGEELRVALDDRPSALPSASANAPAVPPAESGATPVTPEPSASAQRPELVPWQDLARRERYADALAAAEANGFDATCRAATAKDLLLLGNAARFAGSAARAEQAFRLVRSRFAGSHEASMAAFFLGRIAYDQRGSRKEAADWFQSYLREEPGGGLAREAAGRLLEAQRALGDRAAARAGAKTYLEKYPSGPHAGLARELLQP